MMLTEHKLDARAGVERFVEMLASGDAAQVEKLIQNGLSTIEKLAPGFRLLEGCEQGPPHHFEGNALVHTGKVFSEVARLSATTQDTERFVLLVAALVHDIEKPSTRDVKEGKVTFFGHAEKAAERIPEFESTFHLSVSEGKLLEFIVRNHMSAHLMKTASDKKRLELYNSPYFAALSLFQEADAISSWKSADGKQHGEILRDFFVSDRRRVLDQESAANREKLLYDSAVSALMESGVKPGPYFGQMKKALREAVVREEIVDVNSAKSWAQNYFQQHPPA